MTGFLLFAPKPTFTDRNGRPLVNGTLSVYGSGSTTLATIYTDDDLTIAAANPVRLNARGEPTTALYLEAGESYRMVLKSAGGGTIYTVDPYRLEAGNNGNVTPPPSGGTIFPQTAAEITAGIVPINTDYPFGHYRRYGASGLITGDDTAAIQTAWNLGLGMSDAGYFNFTQLTVPGGRGMSVEGTQRFRSTLRHTGTGEAIVLGGADIIMPSWDKVTFWPSATTTKYFAFNSATYDVYDAVFGEVEFHIGDSGNNEFTAIEYNGTAGKQKHYPRIKNLRQYGGGRCLHLIGTSGPYANDLDALVRIQETKYDGIMLEGTDGHVIRGSIENCGWAGSSYANLKFFGTANDNTFIGRLENIAGAAGGLIPADKVPLLNYSVGRNNRVISPLSFIPGNGDGLFDVGEVHSRNLSWIGHPVRMRNGSTEGELSLRFCEDSDFTYVMGGNQRADAMGAYPRWGLTAAGREGWSSDLLAWDMEKFADFANSNIRLVNGNWRSDCFDLTDALATPASKTGIAQIFAAAGKVLSVRWPDSTTSTFTGTDQEEWAANFTVGGLSGVAVLSGKAYRVGKIVTVRLGANITGIGTSAPITLSTLPAGFRPAASQTCAGIAVQAGVAVPCKVVVATSGVISVYADTGGANFGTSASTGVESIVLSYNKVA